MPEASGVWGRGRPRSWCPPTARTVKTCLRRHENFLVLWRYDTLSEAYAALETWMSANGLKPAGDAWEVYLTDPGEVPDQADWQTEINWPVSE